MYELSIHAWTYLIIEKVLNISAIKINISIEHKKVKNVVKNTILQNKINFCTVCLRTVYTELFMGISKIDAHKIS